MRVNRAQHGFWKMRRYLCLYLPRWPIQALYQREPELRGKPLALFKRSARGLSLVNCSREANALGLRRGMLMAEARGLAPELLLRELDANADRKALEELALWAGRFSPLIGLYDSPLWEERQQQQKSSLVLDVTGCELCFNGEENLLRLVKSALRIKTEACGGMKVRMAIAPTIGAAWALAHFGRNGTIALSSSKREEHDSLRAALGPLPLKSLRIEPEAIEWLDKLGVRTVGKLLQQPRATLPGRFGATLIERIDQALGDLPEMLPLLRPAPEIHAACAFEHPLDNLELLFSVIEKLVARISRELQARCRGARALECWLYHEIALPVCAEVTLLKGSASEKHLMQLLHTRLEKFAMSLPSKGTHGRPAPRVPAAGGRNGKVHLEAEKGICAVGVHVASSELLDAEQMQFFKRDADSGSLSLTLDRIRTRLGSLAVLRARCIADEQPEDAFRLEPLDDKLIVRGPPDVSSRGSAARPLTVFPRPAPIEIDWPDQSLLAHALHWRGERINVTHSAGPERIETGWWKETPARRDYYIVESVCGRYWLFRDLGSQRWYLHGLFE